MVKAAQEQMPGAGLDSLVQRLVSRFDPDYIYLFGSRARGDFSDESDYDVMVVLADDAPNELLSWQVQAAALMDLSIGRFKDVKFKQRSDFVRQLHLKASMPSAVVRDGRCLYARAGAPELLPFSPAGELKVCEPAGPEYDPVLVENTRDWIRVARNDIRIADLVLREGMFDQSLFHCQQAVEKAMKALLTWNDQPVQKHHDLLDLGSRCLQIDPSIAPEIEPSYPLSRWAVNGRYPPEKADREEARLGLRIACRALDVILSQIPAVVREF